MLDEVVSENTEGVMFTVWPGMHFRTKSTEPCRDLSLTTSSHPRARLNRSIIR